MARSAEQPPSSPEEQQSLSTDDLITIAENSGRGQDFLASFTSFLSVGLSLDDGLKMLNMKAEEAKLRLEELRNERVESLRSNVNTLKGIGGKVMRVAGVLNPLNLLKK